MIPTNGHGLLQYLLSKIFIALIKTTYKMFNIDQTYFYRIYIKVLNIHQFSLYFIIKYLYTYTFCVKNIRYIIILVAYTYIYFDYNVFKIYNYLKV